MTGFTARPRDECASGTVGAPDIWVWGQRFVVSMVGPDGEFIPRRLGEMESTPTGK